MSKCCGIDINQLNGELGGNYICHVIDHQYNPGYCCNSGHFKCLLETKSGKFVKVMNKNITWRWDFLFKSDVVKPMTEADRDNTKTSATDHCDVSSIEKNTFDTANYIVDILKSNKYDFLPRVVFDTENYIGTEWYGQEWRPVEQKDLLFNMLGKNIPTKLFRKIAGDVIQLQQESIIDLPTDQKAKLKEFLHDVCKRFYANLSDDIFSEFWNSRNEYDIVMSFKSLHIQDIFINVNDNTRWAYVDVENFILGDINRSFYINTEKHEHVDESGYHLPLPHVYEDNITHVNYWCDGEWSTMNV